jgi:Lysine methyltransferase
MYIATDQLYTLKLLKNNIMENRSDISKSSRSSNRHRAPSNSADWYGNTKIKPLDWETDSVASLYSDLGLSTAQDQIHLVVACDCIYNESLIEPFVKTCVDICQLSSGATTICVVAQQLRSPDVFETWLKVFHRSFCTWRLPDDMASSDIGENSGFVVHIGQLRNTSADKKE